MPQAEGPETPALLLLPLLLLVNTVLPMRIREQVSASAHQGFLPAVLFFRCLFGDFGLLVGDTCS